MAGQPTENRKRRFRVALSFAGEKRAFVAQVAALLARRFGEDEVLYDKYHEAEFARHDLGIYLPKLYGEQSDLIVAVLSKDYDHKRWTGWEWLQIHGLLTKADGRRVMPCRFDFASVDGLSAAAAFVELDDKSPEVAARLILERLAINEQRPKDHYIRPAMAEVARPPAQIPNNLPRPQPFFGRAEELKKIAAALGPDTRGWGVLIDGPGGMGKTALAVRAAEMAPADRFQRIVFLSSKERELSADGQRELGHFVLPGYLEMLNAIARELEQPQLTKLAEDERSEAILRALRGAGVLLVLDNLESLPAPDRDQLFAFLNRLPGGCSAIVTSRRRADASAIAIRLDKLDWPATEELLDGLAQHDERLRQAQPDWPALYSETGGNPLLMRWIAGQLGLGRCRTIAAALALLRSAPAGNNPLEFIFGDLLDTFTDNETKVLAALSHFTTPMAVKFIAELAGLNEVAAEGALGDLASRSLVLPDMEERIFVLVPMVADFLRRQRPEAVAETGGRLEQRAYALIVENGHDKHERYPLLNAEWPSVAPALPLLVAGTNARVQTVCGALHTFLDFTGRWDECLWLEQQGEARALAAGDQVGAGWRAVMGGHARRLRGHADLVLAAADRAAVHWQAAGVGARERGVVMQLRGIAHLLKGDHAAALSVYREALALHRGVAAESVDVAIVLNWLANTEMSSGDFDAAERDYDEALRMARSMGYAEGVVNNLGNLGGLALRRSDWSRTECLAREALALAEALGRQELIASNNGRIAKALARQGKAADGLPHALRAVELYARLGSPDLVWARTVVKECGG